MTLYRTLLLTLLTIPALFSLDVYGNIINVIWEDNRHFVLTKDGKSYPVKRHKDDTFKVSIPAFGTYDIMASIEIYDKARSNGNNVKFLNKFIPFGSLEITKKDNNVINNMHHGFYMKVDGAPMVLDKGYIYGLQEKLTDPAGIGSRFNDDNIIVVDLFDNLDSAPRFKYVVIRQGLTQNRWYLEVNGVSAGTSTVKFSDFKKLN